MPSENPDHREPGEIPEAPNNDAHADEAEAENGATVIPGFHECFFKSDGNTRYK